MYRHTQTGTLTLAVIGAAVFVTMLMLFLIPVPPGEEPGRWVAAVAFTIVLGAAALLRSLTITVGDGLLAWRFGPGLIRKWVALADIASVEKARTAFLAGWGIHWTPSGWIYNVSGQDAVRIELKGGRQFFLGTDEPDALIQAIRSAQVTGTAQQS